MIIKFESNQYFSFSLSKKQKFWPQTNSSTSDVRPQNQKIRSDATSLRINRIVSLINTTRAHRNSRGGAYTPCTVLYRAHVDKAKVHRDARIVLAECPFVAAAAAAYPA